MYCPKIKNLLKSFQPRSMKIIYTYQCSGAWNKIKTVVLEVGAFYCLFSLFVSPVEECSKKGYK